MKIKKCNAGDFKALIPNVSEYRKETGEEKAKGEKGFFSTHDLIEHIKELDCCKVPSVDEANAILNELAEDDFLEKVPFGDHIWKFKDTCR
ncbi:hypothetical protein LZP73_17115 [Shewanella sp. AS16]|uniref:hypothetical protein n=1 Tax=Shewanella sp. AS16 TaxID=2907625 RepID=UPI001F31B0D0|nr:hypothetical protein [Shewanella sp. AS16]MCE9687903.1 hypothetical protein [Shewanella sp. AS16]